MRINIIPFIFLGCTVLCGSGCTKDTIPNPPGQDCIESSAFVSNYSAPTLTTFRTSGSAFGYAELPAQNHQFFEPCFNPNNRNQCCFLMSDVSRDANSLCTFDICTGVLKEITQGYAGSITWNKNNWISFYTLGGQTWKVKSNGDSLTQLTFTGAYNTGASWSEEGTRFCYLRERPAPMRMIIADEWGVPVDSITDWNIIDAPMADQWKWNKNGLIAFIEWDRNNTDLHHLKVYDTETKTVKNVATFPMYWAGRIINSCRLSSLDWLNEEEIVAADYGRVYKINTTTLQIDTLLTGADNFNFLFVSTADNRYVLMDLRKFTQGSKDTIYFASDLTILDLQTRKLKSVLVPY